MKFYGLKNGEWVEVDSQTYNNLKAAGKQVRMDQSEQPKQAPKPRPRPVSSSSEAQSSSSGMLSHLRATPEQQENLQQVINDAGLDMTWGEFAAIPASFVAPLLVDELQKHGLDRPGALVGKTVGDLALLAIPPTKLAGVITKAGGAALKGATVGSKLKEAGNFLLKPYTAFGKGAEFTRPIGQATANAADNVVATGIQNAADTQDGNFTDNMGLSALIGAPAGAVAGVRSYAKIGPYESEIAQKTKAKPGSKKEREFEMRERFEDMNDVETNLDAASELIHQYGASEGAFPKSWPAINRHLDTEIAHWNKEARRRSKDQPVSSKKQDEMYYEAVDNLKMFGEPEERAKVVALKRLQSPIIKVRKPVFSNKDEAEKWKKSINEWLEYNKFGWFDGERVYFNKDINPAHVEDTFRKMHSPSLPGKSTKDWKETLRTALRDLRGSEDFVTEGTPDDDSYGYAMAQLERLQRDKNILNYTQGGYGYNQSVPVYSWKQQLDRKHRPGMGFIDYDLEVFPRLSTQSMVNLYEQYPEIKEAFEIFKQYGNSPLLQEKINELSPEARKAAVEAMQETKGIANQRILPELRK